MGKPHTLQQKSYNAVVGVNIKFLRHRNKMTMTDVANKIGVRWQQVYKYETGANQLCLYRANQIANLFEVKLNELADPDLAPKILAIEECKHLNNGEVKAKDYLDSYQFYKSVDEQLKRDDFLEALKQGKNN